MGPEVGLGPVGLDEEECQCRQSTALARRPHGMRPRERALRHGNPYHKLPGGIGGRRTYLCRINVYEHRFTVTKPCAMHLHTGGGWPHLLREPDVWASCLRHASQGGVQTQPGGEDQQKQEEQQPETRARSGAHEKASLSSTLRYYERQRATHVHGLTRHVAGPHTYL